MGEEKKDLEEVEKVEVSESKLTENSVGFQIATSIEWMEGLMQRIHQSLVSNTPLIMCEKDLDVLDFVLLATSAVDPKAVLAVINRAEEEAEKQKTEAEK